MRFDDRVTGKLEAFASHARIVHIDIDPAEIHKNKHAHVPVCADSRQALQVGAGRVGGPCRCRAEGVAAGGAGSGLAAVRAELPREQSAESGSVEQSNKWLDTHNVTLARSVRC